MQPSMYRPSHHQCKVRLPELTTLLPRLLVVDVEKICLVEASMPRYSALNYVWGRAKVFMRFARTFPRFAKQERLRG